MWYEPGPGFLFLIVSTNGPVIYISTLPHPNPNPFFELFLKFDSQLYLLGGGDTGALYI
jgi:hypothetical protein